EAWRQSDLLHRRGEFGLRDAGRRPGGRREALLVFGLIAEEPVGRRIFPEIRRTRLVFFESSSFVLRVGRSGRRDREGRRKRNNTSMDYRFHRVTPLCANAGVIVLKSRGETSVRLA